ncbi:MAG: hypothetical protein ACKVTZ_14720, partial [Bacteroidia bacterium]
MSKFTRVEEMMIQKLSGLIQPYHSEDWLLFQQSFENLAAEEQLRNHLNLPQTPVLPMDWAEMDNLLKETSLDRIVSQQLENYSIENESPDFEAFWAQKEQLTFDREIETRVNEGTFEGSDWADFETKLVEQELKTKVENHVVTEIPDWGNFALHLTENELCTKLAAHQTPILANDWADFTQQYFPETKEFVIKTKLEGLELTPLAGDWAAMERLLEKDKMRFAGFWWKKSSWVLMGLLLALLGLGSWWANQGAQSVQPISKDSVKKETPLVSPQKEAKEEDKIEKSENKTAPNLLQNTASAPVQVSAQPTPLLPRTATSSENRELTTPRNIEHRKEDNSLQNINYQSFNKDLPIAKTYPLISQTLPTTQEIKEMVESPVMVKESSVEKVSPPLPQPEKQVSTVIENGVNPAVTSVLPKATEKAQMVTSSKVENNLNTYQKQISPLSPKAANTLGTSTWVRTEGLFQPKQENKIKLDGVHLGLYSS